MFLSIWDILKGPIIFRYFVHKQTGFCHLFGECTKFNTDQANSWTYFKMEFCTGLSFKIFHPFILLLTKWGGCITKGSFRFPKIPKRTGSHKKEMVLFPRRWLHHFYAKCSDSENYNLFSLKTKYYKKFIRKQTD